MNFEAVKAWYTESVRRRVRNGRIAMVLGLVLMPVALAVAAGLVYALLHGFGRRREEPLSSTTCLWISLAIIPLMFIGNRCTPRRNLMDERMSEGPSDSFGGHYSRRGEVYFQFILWIMFAGPRLLDWALECFREARRLQQQDTHSCAAILWLMLTRGKKVPYEDLEREIPWLNVATALPEVRLIPGVVSLETQPAGLSMTQDLRENIRSGTFD